MTDRKIILDTETTGLDPKSGHRITEVGCVELVGRKVTNQTFQSYINPEREIDIASFNITGLTNAFLKDKPLFIDIADELLSFIGSSDVVIHNARFDIGFLTHEYSMIAKLDQFQDVINNIEVIDTLKLARQKYPGKRNSLDALTKRYNLEHLFERKKHGALLDAKILANVYLALTGGQSNLFDPIEQSQVNKNVELTNSGSNKASSVKVAKISEQEQKSHEEYLKNILDSTEIF